jgi:hypothetical protein
LIDCFKLHLNILVIIITGRRASLPYATTAETNKRSRIENETAAEHSANGT